MKQSRLILYAFIILTVHFLLQASFIAYSFFLGMQRFDNPDTFTRGDIIKYKLSSTGADILTFPLIPLIDKTPLTNIFQEGRGIFAFVLNSLLWGSAAYLILRWRNQKMRGKNNLLNHNLFKHSSPREPHGHINLYRKAR